MDKIAVLIPCYNEGQTIEKVVKDFKRVLPEATVYVYDNNSTDSTASIAESAGAVVRHEYRQGKGNVIRRMFQEINSKCYILTDGDDTYPAEMASEMVEMVLAQRADMVVGDRLSSTYFRENKRLFHNFGNLLVRGGVNWIFKSNIQDIMTGYRAFSYRFVKTFPVLSKGFEIETEMSIHAISMDMCVKNVIIDYRDRPEGSQSKLNTFSDGRKVIITIFNLFRNYRPVQFFSLFALMGFFVAMVAFVSAVWIPYIHTGVVENFPTLIACGFVVTASLMSFFSGLVLDAIRVKERREFELRIMQAEVLMGRCYDDK